MRGRKACGRSISGRNPCIALALGSLLLTGLAKRSFSDSLAKCFTESWVQKVGAKTAESRLVLASQSQTQVKPLPDAAGEKETSSPSSLSLLSQLSEHAFLISTSCSTQRQRDALATLAKVCEPQVRIFERDRNGARGCYFSHLSLYKEALRRNLSWALILEDNLILAQPVEKVQETVSGILQWASESSRGRETSNWSVLHLSLVHSAASLRLRRTEEENIVKVERTAPDWYGPVSIKRAPGLGTTGYIISREAMQKMLSFDQGFDMPIDDLLADRFPDSTFAAFPAPLHRGQTASLINPDQQLFRSVMYDERVFKGIESALVWTGLSSSQLVWLFLASMAAWTIGVTLPMASFLLSNRD